MEGQMPTLDDLFNDEEDAALAAHNAWLKDPVAQAAHNAKVAADLAAREALPEDVEEVWTCPNCGTTDQDGSGECVDCDYGDDDAYNHGDDE
jgi:rubrerythrin